MIAILQATCSLLLVINLFTFFKRDENRGSEDAECAPITKIRINSKQHALLILLVTMSCMAFNFVSLISMIFLFAIHLMRWVFLASLLLEVLIPLLANMPAKKFGIRASLSHFRAILSGGITSLSFMV